MTREALRSIEGDRLTVRARVVFCTRRRTRRPILLKDVTCATTGALLTDHLWIRKGKWAEGVRSGDTIEFEARSKPYAKGYVTREAPAHLRKIDWKLANPRNARRVEKPSIAGLQSPT
jgi:hypothetical protein